MNLDPSRTEGQRVVERMTSIIAHRGPDDFGYYAREGVFLGHRRLSIVDLACGQQPMANETGDIWITYNGEIFNHAELRPGLEAAGHRYKSHSDTETIIHAYEEYGPDCVTHFRGMFAFAIYDEKADVLFCARDRLGVKPFYYFYDGAVFAFASEIKALLEHPAISARFDESQLAEYLAFGYTNSERTLFQRIHKLMPGHTLTLRKRGGAGPEIGQYWEIPLGDPRESKPDAEWIRECRERFEETVRMRLMSDVPLGMFLSGGVDSSAIAAVMTRLNPGARIKTFSVGYAETPFSELTWARQVAGFIGSDHREAVLGMEDFFDSLPNLVWHEDEPIAWPASVSLHRVSQLAAGDVKVVLTGEGSDEMFGGYDRYRYYLWNRRWMAVYGLLPAALRRNVRHLIEEAPLAAPVLRRKALHTFLGRENSFESLQLDNFHCAFGSEEQRSLLAAAARAGEPYEAYLAYWDARPSSSPLARMLYADQKTFLVELLMKQDQMSMAASIESRVPFLEHKFVEFAARVPDSLKLRGSVNKYILKKAVEDLLPRDIVYRRKMGFPTPLRYWLRDSRAKPLFAMLRERDGLLASYLDLNAIAALLERYQRGMEDATDRIWRLLNLQIWGDVFLRGKSDRREGLLPKATAVL